MLSPEIFMKDDDWPSAFESVWLTFNGVGICWFELKPAIRHFVFKPFADSYSRTLYTAKTPVALRKPLLERVDRKLTLNEIITLIYEKCGEALDVKAFSAEHLEAAEPNAFGTDNDESYSAGLLTRCAACKI